MKTIKFFAAALAIVAAASCSKEPVLNDNSDVDEPVLVHKVFTASLETDTDPDFKTTLHTDGKTVHWTAGDQIMLISATSDNVQPFSIIDESIDGTFADFEGETVDADSYRAVYPASAYKSSVSTAEVFGIWSSVLSKQYVVSGNFSQGNRANCPNTNIAISTTSKDNHLYFKNINAYLKFRLNRNDVYSIEVSSDAVTYDREGTLSENADLGSTIRYVATTGHTYLEENVPIEVYGQGNLALAAGVDYYIAIPAVEIEGLTIKVRGAGLSEIFTNKKQSTFKAEPSTIYDLGTLEYVAPPTPSIPAAVGDFFYKDGSYSSEYDSSKGGVVGVVFYTETSPTEDDTTLANSEYSHCTHGLVVGLTETKGQLMSEAKSWNNTSLFMTTIGCTYNSRFDASYLMTGYNNTTALRAANSIANGIKVCDDMPPVSGVSPWFLPTLAEWDEIVKVIGVINNSLTIAGGTSITAGNTYWTVTEENYAGWVARSLINENNGTYSNNYATKESTDEHLLRPIFAF